MATTVRNIRDGTYDPTNPEHVYVGRANRRYRLAAHPLANPYPMRTEAERAPSLSRYGEQLRGWPRLRTLARALRGKTLYCWCAPKACHAHLIAQIADADADEDAIDGYLANREWGDRQQAAWEAALTLAVCAGPHVAASNEVPRG